MSFLKYSRYIESGVSWLQAIPQHWKVRRLKHVCSMFSSNVDKKSVEGQPAVKLCNYTDVYYNEEIHAGLDFMRATATQEQIEKFTLKEGDTLITKDSESPDDIAIPAFVPRTLPGVICGYHLAGIRPKSGVNGRFVSRLFQSSYVKAKCHVGANGLTRYGLSQAALNDLEFPVPPLAEQITIASFLDQETSKIDALISEQQRLIELLKEKRQAVISHAVTKGLNPDVRMKPSGVEWLGEVPEHWEVQRLRFVARLNPSKSEQASIPKETLVSFLPMPAIGEDGRLNLEQQKPIGELEQGYSYFREGDVSIAKITPCFENGKGAVMANLTNGVGFGTTELIVVRPLSDRVTGPYLHHLFVSAQFRRLGESAMYGAGGQKRVPDDFVRNFEVAIPPKSEQQFIVATLEKRISSIDELVLEAEKGIYLLQERRTALISAAVTGKIDVRNYAATQKDAA